MVEYIDASEVSRAIKVLQEPGAVFEVRAIGTAKKDILSGYFRDAESFLAASKTINLRNRNMYITLGRVKDECYARTQSDHFVQSPQTTSDSEITAYRWLFIDFDPVRATGISSSDAELAKAHDLANRAQGYLKTMGFPAPIVAMSGNGYHLLYRVDVKNTKAGRALIEKCLKVLASIFDTDDVKIDTTNYNPSRICKLHGTLAQKGRSTKERPHRMSKLLSVPENVEVAGKNLLEILAAELPDDAPPTRKQAKEYAQAEFDVVEFMHRHGMTYREDSNDRAKIFKLDQCPFDHSHKDGDAKIFLYQNGAIAFKCHHNSCRSYRWQDVRKMFEPDAYEHEDDDGERFDAGWLKHKRLIEAEQTKKPAIIRKLKKASELMEKVLPDPVVYVGVGDELPFLVEGTCILSAKPKLGKSWLALCMCLAVSMGDNFLGYRTQKCSTLYLDLETSEVLQQKRIKKALKGRPVPDNFYIESTTNRLGDGLIEQIEAYLAEDPMIGLIVIDVFQMVRSDAKNFKESEYEHAYRDITPLNELAQKHHIAIILVSHDRKTVDPDDPFSNILGSTGLQGAATQMIVLYKRKPKDPVHISVKGKTIDGLPDMHASFEDATWSAVDFVDGDDSDEEDAQRKFDESPIKDAVLEIADRYETWRGRCSELINQAIICGVPITESPKAVGKFLGTHQGRFARLGVYIVIERNGTGGRIYNITKKTLNVVKNVDIKENQEYTNVGKTLLTVDAEENEYFYMPSFDDLTYT